MPKHIVASLYLWSDGSLNRRSQATSCTLYPCPPATPATLHEKVDGVQFTCVLQP